MKSWQLFLTSRGNDFKVASHVISCSILHNSRLVTNMTSPVELHFHNPVGNFALSTILFQQRQPFWNKYYLFTVCCDYKQLE